MSTMRMMQNHAAPTRTIVACAALLLLVFAEAVPAQTRPGRRERSERRSDREGGDREGGNRSTTEPAGADTRPGSDGRPPATGRSTSDSSRGRSSTVGDDYKILLERSIFARSGAAAAVGLPPSTSTAPALPVLSPQQAVVFVGVLAQDTEFVAFAENRTTNQLMILREGDNVADGKVVAITLDSIQYGSGSAIKEIQLGQNLAGESVSTSFAGGASPTTSSSPTPANMTPAQAAILERLKAARRQQAGQ